MVYQSAARYVTLGPLRMAGGVRVLLNMGERQGYVQLISMLSEVFSTHLASTVTIINSSSAAGVAWVAVVYNPPKDADAKNMDDPCFSPSSPMAARRQRQQHQQQLSQLDSNSSKKLETAQVVFCEPCQAHRFRVVLETISSALSDDGFVATVNVPPPVNPCFGNSSNIFTPTTMVDPARSPPNLSAYRFSSTNQSPPKPSFPSQQKSRCFSSLSGNPSAQGLSIPNGSGPLGNSMCNGGRQDMSGSMQFPPQQGQGQGQGTDLYDPYDYENFQPKVIFTAPACIARLEKEDVWRDVKRGTLKLIQCPNDKGFILHMDTGVLAANITHPIRKKMCFDTTPKAEFGFTYRAMRNYPRGHIEDQYILSFKCQAHADQFRCVMCYVLGVISVLNDDVSYNNNHPSETSLSGSPIPTPPNLIIC